VGGLVGSLRSHTITALQKSLSTTGRAVTDSLSKDIVKQMKYALLDKALPIQRVAADVGVLPSSPYHLLNCLQVLVVVFPADANRSASDVKSVLTSCTMSLEGAHSGLDTDPETFTAVHLTKKGQ